MGKPLRVLIINDSEDDAVLLKQILTEGGYDVFMQRVDNKPALHLALERDWEVIISDYHLPGLAGLEALELVKKKGLDIPFIIISGVVGEEFAVEAMRAGSMDYIKKDNLNRLVPVIERELRESTNRRDRRKAKELALESEERYRKLVENIPLGIFRFSNDPSARVLMGNLAFLEMLGFTRSEEVFQTSIDQLFQDSSEVKRFRKFILKNETDGIELRMQRKDGKIFCGYLTARKGRDSSKSSYFDCTLEDISQRKRAEKLRDAVYNISYAANSAQSLQDLILLIHHTVSELMPAANFYLALLDAEKETISFPYYVDLYDTPPISQPLGKSLTDFVIRNGQPLLASPEIYDDMVKNGHVNVVGTPAVDWLGVPLKTAEHITIGALVVQTYDPGVRYTEDDKEVLTFVSSQAAMAIERKKGEEALRTSEARQRALLDALPYLILIFDLNRILVEVRIPEGSNDFPQYKTGQHISEVFPVASINQALELTQKSLEKNQAQWMDYEYILPGEINPRCYEARISNSGNNQILLIVRNVTEQRTARKRLEEQRAFLRQVIDINPNLIFIKDRDGRFTLVNQAVADIYNTTVEDLVGKNEETFNPNWNEVDAFRRDDLEVMDTFQPKTISEETVTDKNGKLHYLQTVKRPLKIDETGEVHVLGVATDITDRKRAEQQLVHSALHDTLTGLPNRSLFLDRLGRALERTRRHPQTFLAVLLLDFDRFAMVNDSMGHVVGDHLLIAASSRLESCLRTADTIARIGGDEFIILLEDLTNASDAIQIAERLLEEMAVPFNLLGQKVVVTTSIGVVLSEPIYDKPEDILRDADIAMYRAKTLGRGKYILFSNVMRADVVAHLELETDLRQAAEKRELQVHYQPIIKLSDGSLSGFEALMRWRHPRRGLIQPDDFIPFAEETNLIIQLGGWVLNEACRQLKVWHDSIPALANTHMSVNLSAKQFSQPNLVELVQMALQTAKLDPKFLRLEITETNMMENPEGGIAALNSLRNLGVFVDVDDFGTGYSSLVYLHNLPLNAVKIDRSFFSGSVAKPNGMRIVQSIIRLAQDLNLETVAEGVDEPSQLVQLKNMGCDYIQGFIFAKGLDKGSVERFLANDLKRIGKTCLDISQLALEN